MFLPKTSVGLGKRGGWVECFKIVKNCLLDCNDTGAQSWELTCKLWTLSQLYSLLLQDVRCLIGGNFRLQRHQSDLLAGLGTSQWEEVHNSQQKSAKKQIKPRPSVQKLPGAAAPQAQQQGLLPQRELRLPANQQQQGGRRGSVPAWQDGDLNASEEQGGGELGWGQTEASSALQELLQPPGTLNIPTRSVLLMFVACYGWRVVGGTLLLYLAAGRGLSQLCVRCWCCELERIIIREILISNVPAALRAVKDDATITLIFSEDWLDHRINSNLEKHNERRRTAGPAYQSKISVHYDWIPFHHYQSDWIWSWLVQPSLKLPVCQL